MQILFRLHRWLTDLNLFESGSTEQETVEEERWSTRFYTVAMLTSIVILIAYTALGTRVVNVTVKNPSHAVFEDLQSKYPATLKCPCSHIAIEHQAFFNLEPEFHQVGSYNITDFAVNSPVLPAEIQQLCLLSFPEATNALVLF